MKKNWIKIGLVFVLAIGILSIGIAMKWNQGYIMDSDENIRLAMADYMNKPEDELQLLRSYQYQEDDMNLIIAMAKFNGGYALCMFEQTQSHKYKGYYMYSATHIDDTILKFKDQRHDVYIIATHNPLYQIKYIKLITNDKEYRESDIELISEDETYIIRCYSNKDDRILGVSPLDESGSWNERISVTSTTIQ